MIGQKINIKFFSILDSFPHFLIVQGPVGSGRSTLVKEECAKRHIHVEEVAGDIATIREIVENSKKMDYDMCYIIDAEVMTKEAGNALLKTCEESGPRTHIVLKSSENTLMLETLLSRAIMIRMDPYSREDILEFVGTLKKDYGLTDDDVPYLLNLFTTPGDVKTLLLTPSKGRELIDYAETFLTNIDRVVPAEASKIITRLRYKDDQTEGYPAALFMRIVMRLLDFRRPESIEDAVRVQNLYKRTSSALLKMGNPSLNKERIIMQWILSCNKGSYIIKEDELGGQA